MTFLVLEDVQGTVKPGRKEVSFEYLSELVSGRMVELNVEHYQD